MQRRNFLKTLGLAIAASYIGIKVSAAAERVSPKRVDRLAGYTPEISPDGRELYRFTVGQGKNFETMQEFLDFIPSNRKNTQFVGEVHSNQIMPHTLEPYRDKFFHIQPAPGKGYDD